MTRAPLKGVVMTGGTDGTPISRTPALSGSTTAGLILVALLVAVFALRFVAGFPMH